AGSTVTVVASGVTNPAPGSYSLAINTNKDTQPANTATYSIAATSPSAVTAAVSPNTAGVKATYTVGFTTSSTGALTASTVTTAGDTITITGPAGTSFS